MVTMGAGRSDGRGRTRDGEDEWSVFVALT